MTLSCDQQHALTLGRPLIITSAFSYGSEALWPLMHSIEIHSPTAQVLVFTSTQDLAQLSPLCERFPFLRLEPVRFPPRVIKGRMALLRKLAARCRSKLRRVRQLVLADQSVAIEQAPGWGLNTVHAHFLIRRFFWAQRYLQGCQDHDFSHVMLCDVRDVFLQSDPFSDLGDELVSGEEYRRIKDCPMNRGWLRQAYGPAVEHSLLQEMILCAGVTLGSKKQIQIYLDLFCDEVLAVMRQARTSCLSNLDQAIHNTTLRRARSIAFSPSPVNGRIATVGGVPASEVAVDEGSGLVRVMGRASAVIHQYDRHQLLTQHVSGWQ
jgi:hypothetical protein